MKRPIPPDRLKSMVNIPLAEIKNTSEKRSKIDRMIKSKVSLNLFNIQAQEGEETVLIEEEGYKIDPSIISSINNKEITDSPKIAFNEKS